HRAEPRPHPARAGPRLLPQLRGIVPIPKDRAAADQQAKQGASDDSRNVDNIATVQSVGSSTRTSNQGTDREAFQEALLLRDGGRDGQSCAAKSIPHPPRDVHVPP